MSELLDMAVAGKVKPKIEVSEFEGLNGVLERLANYQIDGRVVVKIPQ